MARNLETGGGHMKSASKKMSAADAARIGHSELQTACDDFADSWNYGFGQLSKMTKGVSKFAKNAADKFDELDQKLRDELKKAAEQRKKGK
ncbi:hypothetical protein [Streptomyces sp. NBC_00996]|uniref:hypothetical protein n=1 Tax=Streptomyces sp. NBC_00996 TaxID=2903710 RepID=UPI0038674E16|nr:hypothetical protein OG390_24690 [Streptomyces sp. NBC_00996]